MNFSLPISILLFGFIIGHILFNLIQWYYHSNLARSSNPKPRKITVREVRWWKVKLITSPWSFIELIHALGYGILYLHFGLSWEFVGGALLFSLMLVISIIDIDTKTIPDLISLTCLVILLIFRIFLYPIGYFNMLYGFLLNGGLFVLLVIVTKGAMGGGDIRLAALLGVFLGWQDGLLAVVISFILGSIGGIILLITKKGHGKTPIPFGPFLGMGGLLSYLYSSKIFIV